jgi:DNA-binding protein HU-beta
MDKRTLIKKVAEQTGFTQSDTRTIINSFISNVNEALFFGMDVKISEFANFELKVSPEQNKRNPRTGEQVIVPKHYRCKVSISKTLKDKLKTKTVY